MPTINPYINFNGKTEEAFNFYKSVFGGEFINIIRFGEMSCDQFQVFEQDKNKIMHIALPIGNNVLMGNDIPDGAGEFNELEHRSKIAVGASNRDEADRLFNGLSAGGTVECPLSDSPWGSYFGMFRDKYGIEWTVDCDERISNNLD